MQPSSLHSGDVVRGLAGPALAAGLSAGAIVFAGSALADEPAGTIWVDDSCPDGEVLDPDGQRDATPCWRAAIVSNRARGGGRISVRAHPETASRAPTYRITSELPDPGDFATIDGPKGTRLAISSNALSFALFNVSGTTYAGTYVLAEATVPSANKVTLQPAPTFQAGVHLALRITQSAAPGNTFWHVSPVAAVAGQVVTLATPVPPGFEYDPTADKSYVFAFAPRRGLRMAGLELDGSGLVPPTYVGASLYGVRLNYCVSCEFELVLRSFRTPSTSNLQPGSATGMHAHVGFDNRFRLVSITSGSANLADQELDAQTAGEWRATSCMAAGFGPKLEYSTYMHVPEIVSEGAFVRGWKLQGVLASSFGSLTGSGAGATGCAITLGSSYNRIELARCNGNGRRGFAWAGTNRIGLWFSDQRNRSNSIGQVIAHGNGVADVQVFKSDTGNAIELAEVDSAVRVMDAGRLRLGRLSARPDMSHPSPAHGLGSCAGRVSPSGPQLGPS